MPSYIDIYRLTIGLRKHIWSLDTEGMEKHETENWDNSELEGLKSHLVVIWTMGNTNLKNKLYSTLFFVIIWKWKATEVDKRKQNFCMALQKIKLVGHITCMCHIIMHKSLCTTPVVHCNSISIVYGFKCLESANMTKIDEHILYLDSFGREVWSESIQPTLMLTQLIFFHVLTRIYIS